MRGPVVVVSVLAVAALVTMQWLGLFGGGDVAPPPGPATPGASSTNGRPAPANPTAPPAPLPAAIPGLVATRTVATPPVSKNLADAPTAFLRVLDHATKRPVAGAPIRTVQAGSEIAFTDELGLAALPLREPEQLAVVVPGYLLRLVPTRLGSTESEPQEVSLVRDDWSIVRRFAFTTADGPLPGDVFVRFRPHGAPPKSTSPTLPDDAVLKRAWNEHGMLAGRPVCADVPVQLGAWNAERVHRLTSDTDVRFLGPGEFTLEAATVAGAVARCEVRIDAMPRTNAPPIPVRLEPGAWASGTVLDTAAAAAPVADAKITIQDAEPLGLQATTLADGTFRIGPLQPGPVTLHVVHGDHELLALGPFAAPATNLRIQLRPLAGSTLRGRVRTRPHLRPIAGATVQFAPTHGTPLIAKTGDDGTFILPAKGNADGRLAVQAPGYLAWVELIAPGAPFQDYDLWPGTTSERLAGGLVALLEGVVVDGEGRPVADADVRWAPAAATRPPGVPGRRTLEGATLTLPLATRTGADGAFKLETDQFGPGRVHLSGDAANGVEVTAVAAQTRNDLRLRR
ncbi:MAG: hypothetical protein WBO45_04930 [Planctomycetota bacterium]